MFLVPPLALAFNVKEALFTALTTVSTVAIFPASAVGTSTVPFLSPDSTVFTVPVLTFTPAASTTNEESAGFTVIWLVSFFSNPLPTFTLYLILEVA